MESDKSGEKLDRQPVRGDTLSIGDRVRRAELWMIWLTAAIALFALAAAIVGFFQWRAMSGQLDAMRSGGTDTHDLASAAQIAASAATIQSNATNKLADAASAANSDSVNQFMLDRRAWIAPEDAGFTEDLVAGKTVHFAILYRNVGKDPATDVRAHYSIKAVATATFIDHTINRIIERDDICKGIGVTPGAEIIYPNLASAYQTSFDVTPALATSDLVAGNTALIVEMCIGYRTAREIHHTAFCYFYLAGLSKGNRFGKCPAGHHAD